MEIAATTTSFSCQSFWSLCSKAFMENILNRANDQWCHLLQREITCEIHTCIKAYSNCKKEMEKRGKKERISG